MKKAITLALVAAMVCSMTACGGKTESAAPAETKAPETQAAAADGETEAAAETADPQPADYFTGNYGELPADGETVNLVLAHAGAENSDAQTIAVAMKDAMEKYSDGKITVTIYPNGQMGSDSEMLASCLAGDIDLVVQTGSAHASQVPATQIFDTPFLLSAYDVEDIEAVMIDSEFRDMYDAEAEKGGLKLLELKCADTMNLTSNKAVYSIDDLKGLKIRTAQVESRMAVWAAAGANPTPLAFSELYMALQNGTVDAQDNVWANAVTSGAAEQQKYMIPTQHFRPSMEAVMNLNKFQALPEAYQQFIENVFDDMTRFDYAMSVAHEQVFYQQLQSEFGLEVCEVSPEFNQALVDACAEPIQAVHDSVGNEELYSTLIACMDAQAAK